MVMIRITRITNIKAKLVQQPVLVDDNIDYDHDHDHKDVGDNEDDVVVHLKQLVLFDNSLFSLMIVMRMMIKKMATTR